ncbi:MAG TPA: GSCFA domain-containing protein [Prevotella sp.]
MEFRTVVNIPKGSFEIQPLERMLFVGSCFAQNMGQRFQEEQFRAVVNPFGVMYNPASILHTVERYDGPAPSVAVFTLGTNHVYRLKATNEIVDNCQKRPQSLFTEEELSVEACTCYLEKAVELLRKRHAEVKIIVTVSPIRYRKYGYHGSQLSKATLLLGADALCRRCQGVEYFPAYELMNDELRDYRFYNEDMLHPNHQAVTYIYERFSECYFGKETTAFLAKWKPIKEALNHKPFDAESEEYRLFKAKTQQQLEQLCEEYPALKENVKH